MGHFVYFLAFALTVTAVFGRIVPKNKDFIQVNIKETVPKAKDMVQFNIEAKETQSDENYTVAVDLGNMDVKSENNLTERLVSRQYVNAIKNSKLWNEVKTKALSAKGPTELSATFAKYESLPVDQWPDSILDEVKQICHDGLKCVVMDQLYMMSQYLNTENNGDQTLRTVITKVSNVLTDYKKIYEKSVIQYSTFIDPENVDTISESIMKVVKDNNQLCKSEQMEVQLTDHQVDTWVDKVTTIDNVMDTLQTIVNQQKKE